MIVYSIIYNERSLGAVKKLKRAHRVNRLELRTKHRTESDGKGKGTEQGLKQGTGAGALVFELE